MTCPVCRYGGCRRSRRRNVRDYLLGVFGILPWRCGACHTRFYALAVPLSHFLYAHCSLCGNVELQRISAGYVSGLLGFLGRRLHFRALRCQRCRHKFFTVKPLHPEPMRTAAASATQAPSG